IVAGTNIWLLRGVTTASRLSDGPAAPVAAHRTVIAMMPKAKGDPYFVSCRAGAEEAARELDVELLWDGPTGLDAAKQNELVENWITRKVDAIGVALENRGAISTAIRNPRALPPSRRAWSRTGSRARATRFPSPSRTGPAFPRCSAKRASAASAS